MIAALGFKDGGTAWAGAASIGLALLVSGCGQPVPGQPAEAGGTPENLVAEATRNARGSAATECPFESNMRWDSRCVNLRVVMEDVTAGWPWHGHLEVENNCDLGVAVVTAPVLTLADPDEITRLPLPLGFSGPAATLFVLPPTADIPQILNRGGTLLHGGVEVRGCPRFTTVGPRRTAVVPIGGAPDELGALAAGEYLPILETYVAPAGRARQASPMDLDRSPRVHNEAAMDEERLRVGRAVVRVGATVRAFSVKAPARQWPVELYPDWPNNPFVGYDPLAPRVFSLALDRFGLTLLAEVVIIALAIRRRRRLLREGEIAYRLRERLPEVYSGRAILEGESASLWALPFLVWSLQATYVMPDALATTFMGLASMHGPEFVWEALYSTGLALVLLVCFQALAVLAVEGWRTGHLGLSGPWRVAVQYAVASAILNSFLLVADYGVF